jgi:WD40 repeat protein
MSLSNENILKLIFSTNMLFKIKQNLNMINNRLLFNMFLSITAYSQIYKSLGITKHIIQGHSDDIDTLVILPNQNSMISGSKDKTLKLWDMDNYSSISSPLNEGPVYIYYTPA